VPTIDPVPVPLRLNSNDTVGMSTYASTVRPVHMADGQLWDETTNRYQPGGCPVIVK
jgi:hypothetical protein